jgi:hypothetical protein
MTSWSATIGSRFEASRGQKAKILKMIITRFIRKKEISLTLGFQVLVE